MIFRKTTGNFGNYFRDELSDDKNDNNNLNKSVIEPKSFKYKTSITRSTYNIVKNITDVQGNEIYNPAYDEKKIINFLFNLFQKKEIQYLHNQDH